MTICNVRPFADEHLQLAHRAHEIDLQLIHAKPDAEVTDIVDGLMLFLN